MAKIKLKDQLGRVIRIPVEAKATTPAKPVTPPEVETPTPGASPTVWKLIREIPKNITALAGLSGTGFPIRHADGSWGQDGTTTDLPEGDNLYFTDTRARDAVGAALDGAGDVPLTYDGTFHATLSAAVQASLDAADSAVQPGAGVSVLANDAGYMDAAETDARITVQKGLAGGLATLGDDARIPVAQVHQKLEALTGGTWIPEVSGDNVNVAGTSPVEVTLGVKNTGGGTAVFHYYFKPSGGGYPGNGQLLGGAGSRPWAGSDWTAHSTAAYHLIATEAHTASAQGTDFAIIATPIGATEAGRVSVARFNGDGDIICSKGAIDRKLNILERGRGLEVARSGVAAEVSLSSDTNIPYATLFRGYAVGGTLAAPGATLNNTGSGYALCGHDGTAMVGAKALIGLLSANNWSATNTPASVHVETTAQGSTARTRRWTFTDAGHFHPGADNSYDVGSGSLRPRQYYGANATISTSDARLKTSPRDMTDAEVLAFSAIARLPNVWQWIERVEAEGDAARLHAGPTVQAAIAVMEANGLTWSDYAAFCFDEWPEQAEVRDPETSDVVLAYRPAGDRYSFRREELLAWIVRAQAAQFDNLAARVAALESNGA